MISVTVLVGGSYIVACLKILDARLMALARAGGRLKLALAWLFSWEWDQVAGQELPVGWWRSSCGQRLVTADDTSHRLTVLGSMFKVMRT